MPTNLDIHYCITNIKNQPWVYKKYNLPDFIIHKLEKYKIRPKLWYKGLYSSDNEDTFCTYINITLDYEVIKYYMGVCLKLRLITPSYNTCPYIIIKYCDYVSIDNYFKDRETPSDLAPCGNIDGLNWCINEYIVLTEFLCEGDNLSDAYLNILHNTLIRFAVGSKKHVLFTFIKYNRIDLVKSYVELHGKIKHDTTTVYAKPTRLSELELIKSVLSPDNTIMLDPTSCVKLLSRNINKTISITNYRVYSNMKWECITFSAYYHKILHLCSNEYPCKYVKLDQSKWIIMLDDTLALVESIKDTVYRSIMYTGEDISIHVDLVGQCSFYIKSTDLFAMVVLFRRKYNILKDVYIDNVKVDLDDFTSYD